MALKPFVLGFQNSDGWCIQSGFRATGANQTITLKKKYKDTNYFVQSQDYGTVQDSNNNGISVTSKTTSTFMFKPYTNNRTATWMASGYIN